MSRIHEALKKAESERAQGAEPELSEAAPVGAREALLNEPAGPGAEGAAPRQEAAPRWPEPVTIEALRQLCPASAWHPDPKVSLFADKQDHAPGSEEFRTLRSRLYQIREKHPLQTLLVSSALPGEGKTFVALNLAQAIAQQASRQVLVIDGDLRLPRIHEMLGAAQSPGLSDYLRGEADISTILQRGALVNLFLVASGTAHTNPAELLSGGRMRVLLSQLAPAFDWIVLDSPPAVPLSDASLLAEFSDGVLVVVQSGVTPFDMAQKMREMMPDKNFVGVVLNRVPASMTYSSYYYSYGYGRQSQDGNHQG